LVDKFRTKKWVLVECANKFVEEDEEEGKHGRMTTRRPAGLLMVLAGEWRTNGAREEAGWGLLLLADGPRTIGRMNEVAKQAGNPIVLALPYLPSLPSCPGVDE